MIFPDSTVRTIIDGVSFLFLMVISVYIPFVICFSIETTRTLQIFEFLIDCWFIFEIAMNFITGYYEKGVLVLKFTSIAKNYVQGFFFVDIISSIPISFLSFDNTMIESISPSAL